MAHHFEIKRNRAGEYVAYFKYNSETIFWTEGYSSRASALNAIKSMKKNGPSSETRDESYDQFRALAALSAPNPNLIVRVDRASQEYKAIEGAFRDLSDEIRKTNDLRGLTSDELDVARQEIGEIGDEVKKDKFRAAHLWNILKSTLTWIAEKSGDVVVKALALKLLMAAAQLIGIDLPLP